MSSQWGSQKLLHGLVSHELTVYRSIFNQFKVNELWSYYQRACKPDNFESGHYSLKLSFTNIRGFCSNFVDCKSFLESNSPDIYTLCVTNLNDSIDSSNFSVRVYLILTWKDSSTCMRGLTVYAKEELSFARNLFLENVAGSYLWFRLALFHSVPYFFFLYWSPSLSYLLYLNGRFLSLFYLI